MFQNKTVNIIFSILAAIVLWAYVIIEDNPSVTKKFDNLPIQILNEESLTARGLTVLDDEIPTVTVTVEGKRADINKLTSEDFIVTVDVYGYTLGENHIPVNVDAPGNITVTEVKSSRITVILDELVNVAHELEVVSETDIPKGTELYVVETLPQEVMLTGAKTIVSDVKTVQAVIDAGPLGEEPATVRGTVIALDSNGEASTALSLSSDVAEVTAQLLSVKEVPLELNVKGEVASEFAVSDIRVPKTIKIIGKAADLANIDSIKAKDVDISGIEATSKLPIEAELPEGVYVSKASKDDYVYVVVGGIAFEDFDVPADGITFTGLAEGCRAELAEDIGTTIHVLAKGSEDVMKTADIADFTLSADVTGLAEGEHIVALDIEYTKKFVGVEADPPLIKVLIINEAQ